MYPDFASHRDTVITSYRAGRVHSGICLVCERLIERGIEIAE